jgi:hypothetical protein
VLRDAIAKLASRALLLFLQQRRNRMLFQDQQSPAEPLRSRSQAA